MEILSLHMKFNNNVLIFSITHIVDRVIYRLQN